MLDVLLLEDDDGLRFTFAMALKDMGYSVKSVSTCDQALEHIAENSPDILILDLKIGRGTSLNVADYATIKHPDVAVLYVTGTDLFPRGELFGLSSNTRWVLRKPVNLMDLVSMVDHAANVQRAPIRAT